jgi:hypothetical protein
MIPEVLLIAKTQVEWNIFLKTIKQLIGHNVSQALDSSRVDGLAAFICSLGEMETDVLDSVFILRNAGSLLEHIMYSFLLVAERELFRTISFKTKLSIHEVKTIRDGIDCGIISGNLSEWRTAIINCTTGTESQDLRIFLNKVLFLFERDGLHELWVLYEKEWLPDATVKLIEK